jgi:hypothetical protein
MEQELNEHRRILTEAWQRGLIAIGLPLSVALLVMLVVNWQLIKLVASLATNQCPVELI